MKVFCNAVHMNHDPTANIKIISIYYPVFLAVLLTETKIVGAKNRLSKLTKRTNIVWSLP